MKVLAFVLRKKNLLFLVAGSFMLKFSSAQNINLDSIIISAMNVKHCPGVAGLILKKGIPVWEHNYGYAKLDDSIPVTENTSFMLASISKTFICAAIMQLVEQGAIDPDSNVNNYLPFEFHNPHYPDSVITVMDLLTHTSSIKDNWNLLYSLYVYGEDSPIPLANFMYDYLNENGSYYSSAQNFYNLIPGTHYFYSNEGATLAAYLVENISGISFADYCNQNIFTPLCMDNTSWFISQLDTNNVAMPYHYSGGIGYVPMGYYSYPDYPDGQLRTSIISLAKYLAMMMNHGSFNNQQILNSATVDEIFSPQIPDIDPTQGIIWYQVNIGGNICWGHNGGDEGVSTNMYFSPADSTGVILLANGNNFYPTGVLSAMFDYAESLEPSPGDTFDCSIALNIPEQLPVKNLWEVFPNPTSSLIFLQGKNSTPVSIEISDLSGRILLREISSSKKAIDLSSFAAGIYFLKVQDAGRKQMIKVVKR